MTIPPLFKSALLLLILSVPIAKADQLGDALTRQMQINRERYGIAGQALLVMHNDTVLFRGVDGIVDLDSKRPVQLDDIFPVYSVSKLFVSTLIYQLVEQGKVRLDAPIGNSNIPDLPTQWRAITIRQLLNHTSGLPEYFRLDSAPPPDRKSLFASLAQQPLAFKPGTDTRYNQTEFVVLSALLETVYGKPYPQIAKQRIIDRLHLQHTWLGAQDIPDKLLVKAYIGKNGVLQPEPLAPMPPYSFGHAWLNTTLDDYAVFLRALRDGELVGSATVQQMWQAPRLADGQRGAFASGWEYGESDGYHEVGHDGGTKVRVRIAFKDTPAGDSYTVIYFTNGSAKNVWSRVLVDSALAIAAPQLFRNEALAEQLIDFSMQSSDDAAMSGEVERLRADKSADLEKNINRAGYMIRDNLGIEPAIRVFTLNTLLFPASANVWDSLAEAYQTKGDTSQAQALYEKSRQPGMRQTR